MQETIGFFGSKKKWFFQVSVVWIEQNAFFTLQGPLGFLHWLGPSLDPFHEKSGNRNKTPHIGTFFTHTKPMGEIDFHGRKMPQQIMVCWEMSLKCLGFIGCSRAQNHAFLNPLVFPGLRCFGPYSASKTDPSNLALVFWMPKGRLNSNHQGFLTPGFSPPHLLFIYSYRGQKRCVFCPWHHGTLSSRTVPQWG